MSIKEVEVTPCEHSDFIALKQMSYRQDGVHKRWDLVEVHDSVAILLYHKNRESFVLVKQFRPAVYLKNGEGYTYELCAGIVDKALSLEQIAKEEILEECGYDLPLDAIKKVTSFYSAVGFAGSKQTLFYAEIDDSYKVSEGGGIDVEQIEVVYLHVKEAKAFLLDESYAKTPGLMFAFMWFFQL